MHAAIHVSTSSRQRNSASVACTVRVMGTQVAVVSLFQCATSAYVEAGNSFLGDQFLFGSSYPFRPIEQTIDDFVALGFQGSVIDKLLYGNVVRLSGLL